MTPITSGELAWARTELETRVSETTLQAAGSISLETKWRRRCARARQRGISTRRVKILLSAAVREWAEA